MKGMKKIKKAISLLLTLSFIMSAIGIISVQAAEEKIDAYAAKLTATDADAVFKLHGTAGEVNTSENKVALSNGNSAVMMYRNVDFGINGVDKVLVYLRASTDFTAKIKLYAYPAGTAPFINYDDNTFIYKDGTTYNCDGGALWKPNNGGELATVGALSVNGTDNVFGGWLTESEFEITINGGSLMQGKYDIFVGANNGDFYGVTFIEYEKTAYRSFEWNEYNYLTNSNVKNEAEKKLAFSNNSSVVIYRNVDFGNVGVKSLNLELAPGVKASASGQSNINLYLIRPGALFDENNNLKTDTYYFKGSNNQLWNTETEQAVFTVKYQDFKDTENLGEWNKRTCVMNINNGTTYRGVYDVVIGVSYGDLYGISFSPLEHSAVSAYEKLSTADAVSLGNTTYIPNNGHIKFSNSDKNLMLFKNVDFGINGSKKMKLFVGCDSTEFNVNMYLVKPKDNKYVDELGRLDGYSVGYGNSLVKDGETSTVPGTVWKDVTFNTGWSEEALEITYTDAHYNSEKPIKGVYDVYIGLTRGDFYGIQFVEADPAESALNAEIYDFSAKEYYDKTEYPTADTTTGVFGSWKNVGDYASWYADFGEEAKLKTVSVYYSVQEQSANSYVTIYADSINEENVIARGVMTYKEGMNPGKSNHSMILPVTKELSGIHKLLLCVEDSPYDNCTEDSGTPRGDITKFAFSSAVNYTQVSNIYDGKMNTALLFDKEFDDDIMYTLAIYNDDKTLAGVASRVITPKDGQNIINLSVSVKDVENYTAKGFVWKASSLTPVSSKDLTPDEDVVREVTCWGDSLTAGNEYKQGYSYPKQIAYRSGLTVNNFGVGGENTNTIAARQGGLNMRVNADFIIPAGTEKTEIELIASNGKAVYPLLQDSTGEKGINPCYINGIEGKLSQSGGKYYFERTSAGTEASISQGTDIITSGMLNNREDILVLWVGQNGGFDSTAELLGVLNSMINYLTYSDKKYVVVGFAHYDYYDNYMSEEFGEHFVPLHNYLLNKSLEHAGITPTEEDLTRIAQDKLPGSILNEGDDVHFNDTGYSIIGDLIYEKMQELGYCE